MSVLMKKTIELLRATDVPINVVARRVGCTPATLHLLKGEGKHAPNVVLCEKLYEYLSNKKLEL